MRHWRIILGFLLLATAAAATTTYTLGGAGDTVTTAATYGFVGGKVGIGTSVIPHGGNGGGILALDGPKESFDGPHIQTTVSGTDTDDYPLFQILSWNHDNISLNFDTYYSSGGFKSSDAGSNFSIYKFGDFLDFRVQTGVTAGNFLGAWKSGFGVRPLEVVFNEDSYSTMDVRMESDAVTDAFLLDASAETLRLGIDTGIGRANNDIAAKLDVLEGTIGDPVARFSSTATGDDPDYVITQARAATTDATMTTLQTIALTADYTYLIEVRVLAHRTGGSGGTNDGCAFVLRGGYKQTSGTAAVLDASTPQAEFESDSNDGCAATMDVSGGNVRVRVTGVAATNYTWHSTATISRVST